MNIGTDLKVEKIMQIDVVTAKETATALEIAKLMDVENVGTVLIVDDNLKLLGIITDRQLVIKVLAKDENPAKLSAANIMTKYPMSIFPDMSCKEALDVMGDYGFRRLPVEKDGKLVGIVSLSDLAPIVEFDDECLADIVNELSSDARYK